MTRRLRLALAVGPLIAAGLVGRFALPGAAGDVIGGVLYTALLYVLIALAWPELRPRTVAVAAFAASAAVELLQLSGAAAALVEVWSPLRVVVGSSFVTTDFLAYGAGALAALAVDARWGEPRS